MAPANLHRDCVGGDTDAACIICYTRVQALTADEASSGEKASMTRQG